MKRETQDVNTVDYKGQKEGKLLFFFNVFYIQGVFTSSLSKLM